MLCVSSSHAKKCFVAFVCNKTQTVDKTHPLTLIKPDAITQTNYIKKYDNKILNLNLNNWPIIDPTEYDKIHGKGKLECIVDEFEDYLIENKLLETKLL